MDILSCHEIIFGAVVPLINVSIEPFVSVVSGRVIEVGKDALIGYVGGELGGNRNAKRSCRLADMDPAHDFAHLPYTWNCENNILHRT